MAVSPPNPDPNGVNLEPDKIAKELGTRTGIPSGYASLKGYLGPANGDFHRIYLDNSFWKWVEVREQDIKHRVVTPDNERDSRDEFWIARGAKVISCQASILHEIESELLGGTDDGSGYIGRPPW